MSTDIDMKWRGIPLPLKNELSFSLVNWTTSLHHCQAYLEHNQNVMKKMTLMYHYQTAPEHVPKVCEKDNFFGHFSDWYKT